MAPPDTPTPSERLADLRSQIEELDQAVVRLVARRRGLARDIGAAKRAAGLPAVDPDRERAVLARVTAVARAEGMPDQEIRRLYELLIEMSRTAQNAER